MFTLICSNKDSKFTQHPLHKALKEVGKIYKNSTKEEQDMALACRQLIQNAIVLWNYLYISEKLVEIEDSK